MVGGSFVVGTEQEPFLQQATITLNGSPVSQEIPVYGSKSLSCRFCTLDLHGKPVLDDRTHTKLAQTAPAGATELWLTEPVDWDPLGGNARVMITSSAESGTMEEFDEANLIEVLDGGYRLRLSTPLKYDHLGETRHFAEGYTVDFRCNVALLSRNVIVQGNALSELDRHGGHIMLHSRGKASIVDRSQGESLVARLENIEVRRTGQMGRIGRYSIRAWTELDPWTAGSCVAQPCPVCRLLLLTQRSGDRDSRARSLSLTDFHMIGSVRNSYVRYNSIHHTYNRAIAIHGVHYLRVQNNGKATVPHARPPAACLYLLSDQSAILFVWRYTVAFETRGHTFFVEDGLETKNIITGNLAALTRELFVGLGTDATPSSYWLVNGDNYVANNIAAGSSHYGL